jgi:hypothetical protein
MLACSVYSKIILVRRCGVVGNLEPRRDQRPLGAQAIGNTSPAALAAEICGQNFSALQRGSVGAMVGATGIEPVTPTMSR